MFRISEFRADDKMINLIANDYRLLQVLSRFGIPLGFNDMTIEEVCNSENVDCDTFLTIVNFIKSSSDAILDDSKVDVGKISVHSLVDYLKQSHGYFLDFCLPSIRRKLLDAITLRDSDVSFLILKLFDEYVADVESHMKEEEQQLFNKVEQLVSNPDMSAAQLPFYSKHHEDVGFKLRELKNIIIKYCPPDSKANLLNAALYDIYRSEDDLVSHCMIEDRLLLPALKNLMENNKKD